MMRKSAPSSETGSILPGCALTDDEMVENWARVELTLPSKVLSIV